MDERKQAVTLFVYRFFYVFLLCAVVYLCLRERLPLREMTVLRLFILAVLAAGISAVDSLKGRNYLYGFLGFLVFYGIFLFAQGVFSKDVTEITDMTVMSVSYFFRELFCLMVFVQGIYLCHLVAEKFVWIKRGAVFLLLAGLVAAMIRKWQIPHSGVAAALLYMAAVLAEWVESGWKKQKQGNISAYLLWLLPFLVGYFVLTAVMPYKDTPYDWAFFINLYQRAQRKTLMLTENLFSFGKEDFGISTTGFSEENRFFGDPDKNEKVVMILANPNRYAGSIYLTGKNYNSFDGRQWTQNAQDGGEDHYLDALTTFCAVYGYDSEYPQDYVRKRTVGVQYEHFHTEYLFAPVKTCGINLEEKKLHTVQRAGDFIFSKKQGFGTTYQVTYAQLNLGNPVFANLMLSEDTVLQQEVFDRAKREITALSEKVSLSDLTDYAERVKRDYAETVELSPDAALFLQEATEGADTDYEKLLALESALRSLTYNERPGKLPAEVDTGSEFLDYFLIESREGYCSYFASAFVLLARAQGMPARYVQGYVVPLEGRTSREVTNRMAHAWPEVWIDGVGWIPFEPTPGFEEQRKLSWEPRRKAETEEKETAENEEIKEWENSGTVLKDSRDEISAQDLEEQMQAEKRERRREILRILGYFLLLIFLLGVLLFLTDVFLEKRREARRTVEERFRLEVSRNLQILAALGYRRHKAETLAELQDRLADKKIEGMESFIAFCEEVLYGERVPDEKAFAFLLQMRENLLKELQREKGKLYLFSRIGLYVSNNFHFCKNP